MEPGVLKRVLVLSCILVLFPFLTRANVLSASLSESLIKAKQEAEARGYIFVTTRDEIISSAKKEGRLRAVTGLSTSAIKPMVEAFKRTYPFLDVHVEEIEGTEADERFLLELKAGRGKGWDSTYLPYDNYKAFLPYQMKFDILGMVSSGVLNIHPRMVDPSQPQHHFRQHGRTGCRIQPQAHLRGQGSKSMGRFPQAGVQGKKVHGGYPAEFGCRSCAGLGIGEDTGVLP